MSLHGAYIEDLETWRYKCQFCDEKFDYKKDVKKHEQMAHESKAKKKGLILST